MKIEDRILEDLRNAEKTFDGDKCYQTVCKDYGDVTVEYNCHTEDDYQTFDWGSSLVQSEDVLDSIEDINAVCYDDNDNEIVVDTDYIRARLVL